MVEVMSALALAAAVELHAGPVGLLVGLAWGGPARRPSPGSGAGQSVFFAFAFAFAPAHAPAHALARAPKWASAILDAGRWALDWIAVHTGVPVLLVAAVLVVVGYKVLKRGFRFALEVAVVAAALLFANEMGWLRW